MACDMAPVSTEIEGHEIDKIQVPEKKELEMRWEIGDVLDFTTMAQ